MPKAHMQLAEFIHGEYMCNSHTVCVCVCVCVCKAHTQHMQLLLAPSC